MDESRVITTSLSSSPIDGSESSFQDEGWLFRSPSHIKAVKYDPDFKPANIRLAQDHLREHAATDINHRYMSPFHAHRDGELATLGLGIHLYFTYLRDLALLLVGLLVLYIPQVVFTICGSMDRSHDMLEWSGTMIANIGYLQTDPADVSAEQAVDVYASRPVKIGHHHYFDIRHITLACGLLDFCVLLGIFGWIIWFLRWRTPAIVTENDMANHTMADHSVMVTRLPRRTKDHSEYHMALKRHFYDVLQRSPSVHTRPNEDVDSLIPEVVLARDFHQTVDELMEIGQLKRELCAIDARRRLGVEPKDKDVKKIQEEIKEYADKISEHMLEAHENRDVVAAFVTFKYPIDKDYIEEMYSSSTYTLLEYLQPAHLRFEGKCLCVTTAPEPEDILWENLDFPQRKRTLAIIGIWCAVIVLLGISFFIVALIRIADKEAPEHPNPLATHWQLKGTIPDGASVPWILCDVRFYDTYDCTGPAELQFMEPINNAMVNDPSFDTAGLCSDPSSLWRVEPGYSGVTGLTYKGPSPTEVKCVSFVQGNVYLTDEDHYGTEGALSRVDVRACDLTDMEDEASPLICTIALPATTGTGRNQFTLANWNENPPTDCDTVDLSGLTDEDFEIMESQEGLSKEWYVTCYCVDDLIRVMKHLSTCSEALWEYILTTILSFAASGVIHIMNSVVKKIIRSMVKYEHPVSNTQRMLLGMTKVFVAQYINTAWIMLLINCKFGDTVHKIKDTVITGEFAELNPPWYSDVGAEFATVSLLHIFFPHLLKLALLPVKYLMRKHKGKKAVLQMDVEEVYEYKEFKIDAKYAVIGAMTCFCFSYCAGIPIIVFFTLCAVFLIYWCDKVELLWASARPPSYGSSLSNVGVALLQIGVVCHCLFTCAMFGHPIVFPSFTIGPYASNLKNIIAEGYEEEEEVFTYEYETFKGLFTSAFWPRIGAYITSWASFLHFVFFCVLVVLFISVIAIGGYVVAAGKAGNFLRSLIQMFEPKANQFTENETLDNLVPTLIAKKRIHSYKMADNPKYARVSHAMLVMYNYVNEKGDSKDDPKDDRASSSSSITTIDH